MQNTLPRLEVPEFHMAFTGHRRILPKDEPAVERGLRIIFEACVFRQSDTAWVFHNGGALGFDTLALNRLLRRTGAPTMLHVPFTYQMDALRQQFDPSVLSLVCTVCGPVEYSPEQHERFQLRNEHMVNMGDILVGYYNGTPGGTKNAIDYALRVGVPFYDIRELTSADIDFWTKET